MVLELRKSWTLLKPFKIVVCRNLALTKAPLHRNQDFDERWSPRPGHVAPLVSASRRTVRGPDVDR